MFIDLLSHGKSSVLITIVPLFSFRSSIYCEGKRLCKGCVLDIGLLRYILPGYELRHTIVDDECDGSRGADVVVSANVEMGDYVAPRGLDMAR